jgi:hypothetical protein
MLAEHAREVFPDLATDEDRIGSPSGPINHLLTLRFPLRRMCVTQAHHRNGGYSMINRTIERMRSASSWILNPTCAIDRFLDQIEKLSVAIVVPSQGAGLSRSEVHIEARLEQFGT